MARKTQYELGFEDGKMAIGMRLGETRKQRDALLAAAEAAVVILRDHVEYDNSEDAPSGEAIALSMLQAAIAAARPEGKV